MRRDGCNMLVSDDRAIAPTIDRAITYSLTRDRPYNNGAESKPLDVLCYSSLPV